MTEDRSVNIRFLDVEEQTPGGCGASHVTFSLGMCGGFCYFHGSTVAVICKALGI